MCQACMPASRKMVKWEWEKCAVRGKKKSVKLLRGKNPSNCLVCGENRNETRKEEAAVKSWPESCLSVTQSFLGNGTMENDFPLFYR